MKVLSCFFEIIESFSQKLKVPFYRKIEIISISSLWIRCCRLAVASKATFPETSYFLFFLNSYSKGLGVISISLLENDGDFGRRPRKLHRNLDRSRLEALERICAFFSEHLVFWGFSTNLFDWKDSGFLADFYRIFQEMYLINFS